jgi:uncharacterized RDD family membrane protein YckC
VTSFREYRERPDANPIDVIHANHILPPGARGFQGQRAGFVSRGIAACIDVFLIFLVVLLTAAALWMMSFIIDPATAAAESGSRVPELLYLVIYGYFLNWVYWTVCWALSGRTIGNLVMGVRVVSRRGHRLGWSGAAVRSAFCAFFPIGLLWVIVSGANRSVQDVVLRTSVIYDWVVGLPTLSRVLGRVPYIAESAEGGS